MAQVFKSPETQAESIVNNPFDIYSLSQEKGKKTPSAFFGNESKRLVNMSPNDYFKFVSHQVGTTPERLMEQRQRVSNELSVDEIRKKMREGVKFDTPWLRLMDRGEPGDVNPYWQEGLHRMLAAGQEYGMDTKFPTYIAYENDSWNEMDTLPMDDFIKHYDKTRLERYNKYKEKERLKQQELDDFYKQETADRFGILLDAVTPELIARYKKEEDDMWREEKDWNY